MPTLETIQQADRDFCSIEHTCKSLAERQSRLDTLAALVLDFATEHKGQRIAFTNWQGAVEYGQIVGSVAGTIDYFPIEFGRVNTNTVGCTFPHKIIDVTDTVGKSIGHICFDGEFEYFSNGSEIYRALRTNPIATNGFRQGARYECLELHRTQLLALLSS